MLRITIPARPSVELWDSKKEEFINLPATKEYTLQLEHSLVSLSKWESKWCKPFLEKAKRKELTDAESIDYIRCMTLTQNVPSEVYDNIPDDVMEKVIEYIDAPMTATTVSDDPDGRPNKEIITSEVIYYWMIAQNIPVEFQKWHLNRLITLIRVCVAKNTPPKKKKPGDILRSNRALNEARRKKFKTKG